MNCFDHRETAAVASCKQCGKGLCAACVIDLDHGVSCQKHVQEVENLRAMVLQAGLAYSANARYKYLSPSIIFVFGSIFFWYGVLSSGRASGISMTLGGALLALSLVSWVVVRKTFDGQEPRP